MSYSKSLLPNLLKKDSYEVEEEHPLLDDYNQNDNTNYNNDNIEIIVDNSSQENHNLNIPQK